MNEQKTTEKWQDWTEALQAERMRCKVQVQEHVALAIQNSPQAFGLSRAAYKRMPREDVRRMANGIAEALETGTGLLLLQRPDMHDKQFDPYLWWKQTWNLFREIGSKSSMMFSRNLYVSLTRYPYHQFTDMDANVELDPAPQGLRIVK